MGQSKSKEVDIKCSTTGVTGLGNELEKLKICTYNVHMWSDARDDPNIDRVVNLLSELEPDVLCLQVSKICTTFSDLVVNIVPHMWTIAN